MNYSTLKVTSLQLFQVLTQVISLGNWYQVARVAFPPRTEVTGLPSFRIFSRVLIESKCKEFTGTALEGCQQRTRTQIEKEEQELQEMLRQENDQSLIEMMEVHINKYQTDFGHILAKSERGKQYLSETIVTLTQWGDRGLNLIKVIR